MRGDKDEAFFSSLRSFETSINLFLDLIVNIHPIEPIILMQAKAPEAPL